MVDGRFVRAPVASAYLAGYLASQRGDLDNHDVIDSGELLGATSAPLLADLLLRSDPQLVALSTYVWNARTVAETVSELTRRSDATVVLGGPDVQHTPELAFKRFSTADFICTGEGELALLGLVESLETSGRSAREHPPAGIASRLGDGGAAPLVAELDTIPSPFRDGIVSVPKSGWIDLETVRGCPFTCSFCLYGKNLSSVRSFSLARVRADLSWLLAHGATDLYFLDPTFNLPRERCQAILDMLAELNADRRAGIYAEARAEAVDEDLADRMAAAGVRSVEVGLQAVQASALKLMHRGLGRKGFVRGCERLRDRGIRVDIGIILGLPGDTAETIRETIDYATQNLLGEVSAYRLRVLPGSDYWRRARELGLDYAEEPPYFIRQTPLLSNQALEAIEAEVHERLKPHNSAYMDLIGRNATSLVAKLGAAKAAKVTVGKESLQAKKEMLHAKKESLHARKESLQAKEPTHGLSI